jgi:hypothetical protein
LSENTYQLMTRLFMQYITVLVVVFFISVNAGAQQITGIWTGKIDRRKVEIKIVQNGDSLTGTSYYYESGNNYKRYSIKGYFDERSNNVVWWDDQLIEERSGRGLPGAKKLPMLSRADFNCPGEGRMLLEGDAALKENQTTIKGPVDLEKTNNGVFKDEWDFVIHNYTVGANDPYIIDSVALIAFNPNVTPAEKPEETAPVRPRDNMVFIPSQGTGTKTPELRQVVSPPLTIEQKFVTRKKIFVSEIPVDGDSIELRFYDNVQIDGDSISLFLNDRLIFQHLRLTGKPHIVKFAYNDLPDSCELTMVAENLGDIPPNTSYMIAYVGEKRYDVNLSSTEETSAMIRLRKAR